eukprot:Cvel_13024.t2-p1 / transcript=Cvel_13024.t2 / gene=Cvel_13024 / organism=Chromera_velia_CCMP2878 / gene_product=hypothetical protein / transcript_product=hypothetical protein / location=Cvel_scaffold874:37675-39769(-) / protein_length=279 / sequence_SO=supercontig / SO=protein_coding / is_pseudo=false
MFDTMNARAQRENRTLPQELVESPYLWLLKRSFARAEQMARDARGKKIWAGDWKNVKDAEQRRRYQVAVEELQKSKELAIGIQLFTSHQGAWRSHPFKGRWLDDKIRKCKVENDTLAPPDSDTGYAVKRIRPNENYFGTVAFAFNRAAIRFWTRMLWDVDAFAHGLHSLRLPSDFPGNILCNADWMYWSPPPDPNIAFMTSSAIPLASLDLKLDVKKTSGGLRPSPRNFDILTQALEGYLKYLDKGCETKPRAGAQEDLKKYNIRGSMARPQNLQPQGG